MCDQFSWWYSVTLILSGVALLHPLLCVVIVTSSYHLFKVTGSGELFPQRTSLTNAMKVQV